MRVPLSPVWLTLLAIVAICMTIPSRDLCMIREYKVQVVQPRCDAAHLTASRLPFSTSTPNHMTSSEAVQIANKNGNPCQLFCVLSMIAWTTYGPIMDEARFARLNRPKNCGRTSSTSVHKGDEATYHVFEPRWTEFSHHRL